MKIIKINIMKQSNLNLMQSININENNTIIPKAEGYWLSSSGLLIPLYENRKHIDEVISNPSLFDLTIESITQIYNEENEVLGIEGRARERIILACIKNGWIRIRRYPRKASWTINLNKITFTNVYYLQRWSAAMIEYGFFNDDVNIDLPEGLVKYSMKNLLLNHYSTDI